MSFANLTAALLPGKDLLAGALFLYLFFVCLKQAVLRRREARSVFFVIAFLVLPLLAMVHYVAHWDLGEGTSFDDPSHGWVVPLRPVEGVDGVRSLNLATGLLLLSILYVMTSVALGWISLYLRAKGRAPLLALHKALVKLAVLCTGLVIFLKMHHIDLTPFWVGMGAASVVVGIALRDPLSSLFTGLSLEVEGIFKRGDWVRIGTPGGEIVGKVVEKNWRTTRLVTLDDELVTVPNRALGNEIVVNYHQPTSLHVQRLRVGTSYKDPPIKVKEVLRGILLRDPRVARDPPPMVRCVSYGDFAIEYELRFWIRDYGEQQRIKDSIMTRIWYAFRFYGIEIPFPIRTVHMKEEEQLAREEEEIRRRVKTVRGYLTELPYFSAHLRHKDFDFLAENAFERYYAPGEHVIHKGEMGDALYILREGSVEVILPDGRTRVLEAGAYFGEMGLLSSAPRTADVRAGPEGCRTVRIDRECMRLLFRMYPGLLHEFRTVRKTRIEDTGVEEKEEPPPPPSWLKRVSRLLRELLLPW